MRKNFWAALLALCLTLTLGLIPAQAADDKWTDFATPDWGTGGDYTIDSAGDLAAFAEKVNSGISFTGATVTLTDNIDLSSHEWVPIGNQKHPFSGTFDGQGYEISNCTFTSAGNGEQYLSLFGKAENANITDFTVRNFTVDVITAGYNSTAVLAAPVAGDVQNTEISKIEVLNAEIQVDAVTGSNAAYYAVVGGIVAAASVEAGSGSAVSTITDVSVDMTAELVGGKSSGNRFFYGGVCGANGSLPNGIYFGSIPTDTNCVDIAGATLNTTLDVTNNTTEDLYIYAGGVLGYQGAENRRDYAVIEDVESDFTVSHTINGNQSKETYIGGGIGYSGSDVQYSGNSSKINDCKFDLDITVEGSGSYMTDQDYRYGIGGAIGRLWGTGITNGQAVQNPGLIMTNTVCETTVDASNSKRALYSSSTNEAYIGGFLGYSGDIRFENCLALMETETERASSSYSPIFGNIAGDWFGGGNSEKNIISLKNIYTYAVLDGEQDTGMTVNGGSILNMDEDSQDIYYIVPQMMLTGEESAPFRYEVFDNDYGTTANINEGFRYSDGDERDGVDVTGNPSAPLATADQESEACYIAAQLKDNETIQFTLPVRVSDEPYYHIYFEDADDVSYFRLSTNWENNMAPSGAYVTIKKGMGYIMREFSVCPIQANGTLGEPIPVLPSENTIYCDQFAFTMPASDVLVTAKQGSGNYIIAHTAVLNQDGSITPSNEGGTMQPTGVFQVEEGTDVSFEIVPSTGFKFVSILWRTTSTKPRDEFTLDGKIENGEAATAIREGWNLKDNQDGTYAFKFLRIQSPGNALQAVFVPLAVEKIEVTEQPKLTYEDGDRLDLSDLEVTVTYEDGSRSTLEYNDDGLSFAVDGTPISHGDPLTVTEHNGKAITVTYQGKTAQTDQLTVTAKQQPADPTPDPTPGGDTPGGGSQESDPYLRFDSNGGTKFDPIDGHGKDFRINVYDDDEYGSHIPTRPGHRFTGWYRDRKLTMRVGEDELLQVRSAITLFAGWADALVPGMLNGDDHYAYIQGYSDGSVRPNDNITRAQVATIFFRLLDEDVREDYLTADNAFQDVSGDYWANTAISTMASLGIINGRDSGNFDPEAPITRAEFAAICARFDDSAATGVSTFTDTSGHWAEAEISRVAALGWVQGYTNGSFCPDAPITRAQAVTMINRVLCRLPESAEDLLPGMNTWSDCHEDDWFYLAIQEATNSHDFTAKDRTYETWTGMNADPDWSQYE